ncbi:MAG: D-alanine--D-alanine ligase [Planctomycetes bacterium]|nr:D-alanine--D-alanine ligase [Planctomycetota bacterium]
MPRTLRIALAYDATPADPGRGQPRDAVSRNGVLDSVRGMEEALRGLGHRPSRLPMGSDIGSVVASLQRLRPDVVVNLCEGLDDDAAHEAHVAALFELAGVPYTGAPPEALAIALRKPLAKALLSAAGLPVPPGIEIAEAPLAPRAVERAEVPAPWIVKPSREDASLGIDEASVVASARALRERVAWVVERYRQPALVEAFIDGREFNVTVVGDRVREVLPISEIDFSGMPDGHPRILTYEAKWSAGSPADLGSVPVCPARIEAILARRLGGLAEAAVAAVGGRDVTRVDFRLDDTGRPFVLEVNANPDLGPRAGVARQVATRGWTYPEFVLRLCEAAFQRGHVPSTRTPVRKVMTEHAVSDNPSVRARRRRGPTRRSGGSSVSGGAPGPRPELLAGGATGGARGD